MILSASRRTDLPALYGPWLLGRLEAGEVLIPQPYRAGHATRLLFSPQTVDAIVFWTKNPIPFLPLLGEVEALGYRDFLFQYTITALDTHWEPGLPPLEERLAAFEKLAQRLGPARVEWRFDPILLDSERTPAWYARRFGALCRRLAPCTTRCVLSFADHYAHNGSLFREAPPAQMEEAAPAWGRLLLSTACPCTPAPRPGTTLPTVSSTAPASTASGWAGWWAAPSKPKRTAASALPAAAWRAWTSAPTTPASTGAATATPPAAPPLPQDSTPPTIPSRPCSLVGRERTGQFRKSVRPLLKKGSFPCFSGSWKIPPC